MNEQLIRLPEVLRLLKISKNTWYKKISEGAAPQPIKIYRASLWTLSSIQEFIEELKAGEHQ